MKIYIRTGNVHKNPINKKREISLSILGKMPDPRQRSLGSADNFM